MKKQLLSVAAAAVLALSVPGIGWAAVAGTPHDVTTVAPTLASFGVCSACHIPHKAYGARLWPTDQSGAPAARGTVGALCSYCHGPGAGQIAAAETVYPFKDVSLQTHGLTKAVFPDDPAALSGSGLPYTATAAAGMECTSCHNVHDNGTNTQPFLQVVGSNPAQDIDTLCAGCHPNRQFVGGAASNAQGDWGVANMGYVAGAGIGNPGSHPVGQDISGDVSGTGNSPITTDQIGVGGVLDYFAGAPASGTWNLGPHLIDGGTTWQAGNGIGCVTCHAPHGIDSDDHVSTQAPNADLLANAQGSQGAAANGAGDPNNALCEACHRGVTSTYAGTLFPNPGNTTLFTHPVDDYYSGIDFGAALPAGLNWPAGSGGENAPDIICESCHAPHPLALKGTSLHTDTLPAAYAGNDSHILRDYDDAICDDCHASLAVTDHHPIGAGLLGGRMVDALIGDGDNDLECSDCHNGQGGHNWPQEWAPGLDPDWRGPRVNCPPPNFAPDTSFECLVCHTNNGAHYSPTMNTAAGEYQDAGDASHFLGARTGGYDSVGWPNGGTQLNPDGTQGGNGNTFLTTNWDTNPGRPLAGCSGMGGNDAASGQLVCESCHELQPRRNYPGSKLLLAMFTEAYAEPRSLFCEACHSPEATAVGAPHPMTGDTISRAQTAERGTITLITGAGSFADKGANGDTTYPGTDEMNCDSCHQVHDAVNESGTYILENTTGGGTGAITGAPVGSIVSGDSAPITFTNQRYTGAEATKLNYQPFCNLCHSSGQ